MKTKKFISKNNNPQYDLRFDETTTTFGDCTEGQWQSEFLVLGERGGHQLNIPDDSIGINSIGSDLDFYALFSMCY